MLLFPDYSVLLWKMNDNPPPANNIFQDEEEDNKETWTVFKVLRFVSFTFCKAFIIYDM